MSDTPETDAASQSWLRIRTNGETFIDKNRIVLADKMEAMERQRNDALQLARELRDALRRLSEEWAYQEKQGNVPPDRIEATFATDALAKANQLLK